MRIYFIAIFALSIATLEVNAQTMWYEIESNTSQNLEAIDFVEDNPTIGYIGGENVILKTINSGETWTPIVIESHPNEAFAFHIYDILFLDENHGYATSGLSVWETFDGGVNWMNSADGFNCFPYSLHYLSDNTLFIGGSGCFEGHVILRIEDGEAIQAADPDDWAGGGSHVISINFRDDMLGLAGTATGKLLRTTDGGFNWDTIPNVANGMAITDFVFEENLIRATHENQNEFGIMVSEDDGLTWAYDIETATFFYPKMNAAHSNGINATFLGGEEGNGQDFGVIFNNQGEFWAYDIVAQPIMDINSHSDSTTFGVGLNGSIYCNVDPDVINSIDEIDDSGNLEIYPNPAQDYVNISGFVPSNARYEIIDMSGRKIIDGFLGYEASQSINVEKLSPGSYQISIIYNYKNETYNFHKE